MLINGKDKSQTKLWMTKMKKINKLKTIKMFSLTQLII